MPEFRRKNSVEVRASKHTAHKSPGFMGRSREGLDQPCIDPQREDELRFWAQHWKVGKDTIREAVVQVGPLVKDVKKALLRS